MRGWARRADSAHGSNGFPGSFPVVRLGEFASVQLAAVGLRFPFHRAVRTLGRKEPMSNAATQEATKSATNGKGKAQANPETQAPIVPPVVEATNEEKATTLIELIAGRILSLREEIATHKTGALALKSAAKQLGATCEQDGRPTLESWQVFGLMVSAVNPTLALRVECANLARNAAFNRLRLVGKYRQDAKALEKAIDRTAKINGKGSVHDGAATIAVKFGTPDKVAAVYE
jgi:hypothetical protein